MRRRISKHRAQEIRYEIGFARDLELIRGDNPALAAMLYGVYAGFSTARQLATLRILRANARAKQARTDARRGD